MRVAKAKKLEAAGWKVSDTSEFLGLDEVDARTVAIKVALVRLLRAILFVADDVNPQRQ